MTSQRWARPAAGREPAAAALLSWLGDPQAPRLCVVTGTEGSGKSGLLAWLIAHGTRPGTASERRVHGFVPLPGQTATTAAWVLAEQLSVAARTPGELLAALAVDQRRTVLVLPELHAADHPDSLTELILALVELDHVRVIVEVRSRTEHVGALTAVPCARMDLDEPQWTDEARSDAWTATQQPPGAAPVPAEEEPAAPVDLDDPASVSTGDPWQVTAAYERSEETHGGLRAAWLRAGASLIRDQSPAERALVLLAALGDTADPRLPAALNSLAAEASWAVSWSRVRGDVAPPWPGPSRSLATGTGVLAGHLVAADHQGTVRILGLEDARSAGRLPHSAPGVRAVAEHGDGNVTVLDEHGLLYTQRAAESGRPTGLAALLDDGPTTEDQLLQSVREYAGKSSETVTALAGSGTAVILGDAAGKVHFVASGAEPRTAALHRGPVTAAAGIELPAPRAEGEDGEGGGGTLTLLYTGGAEGTVRAWAPHTDPMPEPVAERGCSVSAIAAATTEAGLVLAVAWADGLVEHRVLEQDRTRFFHPGSGVGAVALTSEGDLVVGTDETLVRLQPC